jgi:transposase InsO family protein
MCRIFSVSCSGFYYWLKRGKSRRDEGNEELVNHIRQVHEESEQTYGSPRITGALRQKGIRCNTKRVARLMREHGIASKIKRKFKITTYSAHKRPVAANLIKGQFTAPAPDKVWTSDITYIWTRQGWLYLSVFLDVFSRRIVGWAMKRRMTDQLVLDAFRQAHIRRKAPAGLIVHSDRGSQYCSRSFKELLQKQGYRQSMCSTGNCYDNAITESFFGTLKTELIFHQRYNTRDEARRSIFKYIEMFYNRVRIHSAIGGVSPAQFEQMQNQA